MPALPTRRIRRLRVLSRVAATSWPPRRPRSRRQPRPIADRPPCCSRTCPASPRSPRGWIPRTCAPCRPTCSARCAAVVERFDAFVEKFVGDAVMAVFGAPVAHEDDPQRALHAALEMHACVAVLSERWRDRLGASARAAHRHQFRPGGRRASRIVGGRGLCRDRRRREHGGAPAGRGAGGADAGESRNLPAHAARVRVRVVRHAGAEGQGRGVAGLSAAGCR